MKDRATRESPSADQQEKDRLVPEELPPKVSVALDVVAILSEAQESYPICDGLGNVHLESAGLTPKESAAYSAALDRLEKYIDSPD